MRPCSGTRQTFPNGLHPEFTLQEFADWAAVPEQDNEHDDEQETSR
jgi:hypothetical protein